MLKQISVRCFLFMAIVSVFLISCAPVISPYSQRAYENATSLKPQTIALMEKATTPYSKNIDEIDKLVLELEKAYEYAKGLPWNEVSAEQWRTLITQEDGLLFGDFLNAWKEQGTVSQVYIAGAIEDISYSFDTIICLEISKRNPQECLER